MPREEPKTKATAEYLEELLDARSNSDPVPILTRKAENRIMRELRDLALRGCHGHVRALAECTEGRTLSVIWHCRKFSKAIDLCMREFGKDEALKDEMRRRHGATFPKSVKGYREHSKVSSESSTDP